MTWLDEITIGFIVLGLILMFAVIFELKWYLFIPIVGGGCIISRMIILGGYEKRKWQNNSQIK